MEAVDKAGGDEDYNEDGEWEYEYHETETEVCHVAGRRHSTGTDTSI